MDKQYKEFHFMYAVELLKEKFISNNDRKDNRVYAQPLYDDVFYKGVEWLDSL